ncbi:hypothetical protein PI125_g22212 [Phytophthora idaei]|nr:hypothetical protein PI125_g22212 [Phytophthora idaei]
MRHLLAFAPLLDDTNQNAANHSDSIHRTLEYLTTGPPGAVCLIEDNCTTNVATARLFGVPLLGCSSHRLNLAGERVLKAYAKELDLVAKVMRCMIFTQADPAKADSSKCH